MFKKKSVESVNTELIVVDPGKHTTKAITKNDSIAYFRTKMSDNTQEIEARGNSYSVIYEGKKRLLAVDLSTIGLIKQAYEQETYVENNGGKTNNIRISEPRKMQINKVGNYVFRVPGQSKYEKFTVNLLGSRMNRYKQWFDNPYLTYTSLRDSGIIQTTMDVYEKKGEVTKEDYMDICDRFNYGTESSEGYWNVAKTMFEQYKEMLNNNNK